MSRGRADADSAHVAICATPEELAATIHETANALTVILGWIERAREASAGPPELDSALARASQYTKATRIRMRQAIGASPADEVPEGAGALAERMIDDLSHEARRGAVRLSCSVAPSAQTSSVAGADLVWQALTNLLLNAIALTKQGGCVTIVVTADETLVRFRVSDEGPGIPEASRQGLFTSGVSTRPGGAGIGLRHAHAVAAAHGGHLRLVPDVAVGACFELGWPLSTLAAPRPPPKTKPQPRGKQLQGMRVLLLEDDVAVSELLELALASKGADVVTVNTAGELQTALTTSRFDVMLVDLSPLSPEAGAATDPPDAGAATENSGLDEAVRCARDTNPGIEVVVISGSVTVKPRPDIIWVRKPFETRELIEAILKQHAP